ncbi:MAG: CHAT domain-containing protein [Acidobacteriota bacterium]|nr:CHAT domain-containing protein [Blastocatellia bacterium]MDW8238543.1 CHAT domain-containing protein [Acidobacteriota bacterium]
MEHGFGSESLTEQLIALAGSHPVADVLERHREQITADLIRRFKDKVAHAIRADINRATQLAQLTCQAAMMTDDPICHALAHHSMGMSKHFSGRYAEAVASYEQAEAIYAQLGDEVAAARVGRAKVDALIYLSRYDEALQLAAQARSIFARHSENNLLAQLEMNVGNIYHRLDQYHQALEHYERAEKTFARLDNAFDLAQVWMNQANQYTQLNDFNKALDLYERAHRQYEKLRMPLMVNQVEYSIAWLHFLRGNFKQSLTLFAKSKAKALELGDVTLPILCDLDQAEVYLQLNAYEDAIEFAQRAAEQFHQLGMNYEFAKARMYVGMAYLHLNNFDAAQTALRQARDAFVVEHNDIYVALTNIYLSDVVAHKHDWTQAQQLCAEAKALFVAHNLTTKVAYADLQMARLKFLQADLQAAEALCGAALNALGQMEAPWVKYQCFHLLGNVLHRRGQHQKAYDYYRQAIDYLEAMRSSIRVDEYKCSFLKDKLRVYEDLIELCLATDQHNKLEEAFTNIQAAKSRSLVELLAVERDIRGKVHDASVEALYREWNRIREELDFYYSRINQYQNHGQRPAWMGTELQKEVQEREQQLARLARQLRLQDAEYASLHTTTHIDMDRVRHHLADDEVLIEYFMLNDRLMAFVLDRNDARLVNDVTNLTTTAPLLQWVRFYNEQCTMADRLSPAQLAQAATMQRQCLEKLYAHLIAPIEPLIDGKKLIIAPHGFLHYIPFHALHDGQQFLIDRYEISYCPSANVFTLCTEKARTQSAGDDMLILGISDEAAPLIRDEVQAVKSLWPKARLFMDRDATFERLQQHAPTARWLHLASHGTFRRDNPMFSTLKLSNRWLNLYDIFNLNLNADLVTLSACETGMNEVFPGDELFGLIRGFLYAGAPSLIVSLWVVHDRSTTELMCQLYTGLRQGISKRAALRQAQLTVKEAFEHPYYWAPFILVGATACVPSQNKQAKEKIAPWH